MNERIENKLVKMEDLKTDQEIASFLFGKYQNEIKSVHISDPTKIMIGSTPLPEVIAKLKENVQDPYLSMGIEILEKYKTGPIIVDTFGDEKAKRNEFITRITNHERNALREFFNRNRLKRRNPSNVTQKEFYGDHLSIELKNEREKLAQDVTQSYNKMSQEEKQNIVAQIDILTTKILQELYSKYS